MFLSNHIVAMTEYSLDLIFARFLSRSSLHQESAVVSVTSVSIGASQGKRKLAILTKQISHNNQASQMLCNQKPGFLQMVLAHRPLF